MVDETDVNKYIEEANNGTLESIKFLYGIVSNYTSPGRFNSTPPSYVTTAKEWLINAAHNPEYNGQALAQYYLGLIYHTGRGAVQSTQKAEKLLMESYKQGFFPASIPLGCIYAKMTKWNGTITLHNYTQAEIMLNNYINHKEARTYPAELAKAQDQLAQLEKIQIVEDPHTRAISHTSAELVYGKVVGERRGKPVYKMYTPATQKEDDSDFNQCTTSHLGY